MINTTLKEILNKVKEREGIEISQAEFAKRLGWSTSKLSLLLSGKYESSPDDSIREASKVLLGCDVSQLESTWTPIEINPDVIIRTKDFNGVFQLCNGLLDPSSSLSSSIGLITGEAGRGKTTACKRFCAENSDAIYVLYMGYSRAALFRAISDALLGRSVNSYYGCLDLILAATRLCRKLIIIDEADRIPIKLLEDLRTLNESGEVPILLVGEPVLASTVTRADRIESRIRKPKIAFEPLDYLTLMTLYHEAANIDLDKKTAELLTKMCSRDFRIAANDMQAIVKFMNVNHLTTLTEKVVNEWRR